MSVLLAPYDDEDRDEDNLVSLTELSPAARAATEEEEEETATTQQPQAMGAIDPAQGYFSKIKFHFGG